MQHKSGLATQFWELTEEFAGGGRCWQSREWCVYVHVLCSRGDIQQMTVLHQSHGLQASALTGTNKQRRQQHVSVTGSKLKSCSANGSSQPLYLHAYWMAPAVALVVS